MITLIKSGSYKLIETKSNIKILYLDNEAYVWIAPRDIGQILIRSHVSHKADKPLAAGSYRLYQIKDEPYLTDLQHVELEFGKHTWQGYFLPTGLPTNNKKRAKIIPTTEIITSNPRFRSLIAPPPLTVRLHSHRTQLTHEAT